MRTLKVVHLRLSGPDLASHRMSHRIADQEESRLVDEEVLSIEPQYNPNAKYLRPDFIDADGVPQFPRFNNTVIAFISWAFGPTGFLALEWFALRDFSHSGRFSDHNLLVRRASSSPPETSPSAET